MLTCLASVVGWCRSKDQVIINNNQAISAFIVALTRLSWQAAEVCVGTSSPQGSNFDDVCHSRTNIG
jgi:hypothetical protein